MDVLFKIDMPVQAIASQEKGWVSLGEGGPTCPCRVSSCCWMMLDRSPSTWMDSGSIQMYVR